MSISFQTKGTLDKVDATAFGSEAYEIGREVDIGDAGRITLPAVSPEELELRVAASPSDQAPYVDSKDWRATFDPNEFTFERGPIVGNVPDPDEITWRFSNAAAFTDDFN